MKEQGRGLSTFDSRQWKRPQQPAEPEMASMSHGSDLQAQPTMPAVVSHSRLALGLVPQCPPLGQCLSLFLLVCRAALCPFCLGLSLSVTFPNSGFHMTHRWRAQEGRSIVTSLGYP